MPIWEKEWGHSAFFCGNSSTSEGLAILINPNIPKNNIHVISHNEIVSGRAQSIECMIENRHIELINVYGYNSDNTYVFDKLRIYLNERTDRYFLITGDFNTTLDLNFDKNGGQKNTHPRCRKLIQQIITEYDLTLIITCNSCFG